MIPSRWRTILIPTASGERLPLTRLAKLETVTGPSTIQREWGERRIIVQTNVRGRDIGSFVEEAQDRIEREVFPKLPTGYTIEWGGQFENMQRAERRLFIVIPLALTLILSLLYLTFHSMPRRADDLQRRLVRRGSAACWACGCGACRSQSRPAWDLWHWPVRRCWRARCSSAISATGWPTGSPSAKRSSRRGWHGCVRC